MASNSKTIYHGTNSNESFDYLKTSGASGVIWFTDDRKAAEIYAKKYYNDGEPRVFEATIKPSAKILDLRDISHPVTQIIRDQESMGLGLGVDFRIPDEKWDFYAGFNLFENPRWSAAEILKEEGYDIGIVKDRADGFMYDHLSYAVINPEAIEIKQIVEASEQPRFRWKKSKSSAGGFEIDVFSVADDELVGNITILHGPLEDHEAEALLEEMAPEEVEKLGDVTSIHALNVAKEYRGQGIAKYIYKLALEEIKKSYPTSPVLVLAAPMDEENGGMDLATLVEFYSKAGFKELYSSEHNNEALLYIQSPSSFKAFSALSDDLSPETFQWLVDWVYGHEDYSGIRLDESSVGLTPKIIQELSKYRMKKTRRLYRGQYSEKFEYVAKQFGGQCPTFDEVKMDWGSYTLKGGPTSWSYDFNTADQKFTGNTWEFGYVLEYTFKPEDTLFDYMEMSPEEREELASEVEKQYGVKREYEGEVLVKSGNYTCRIVKLKNCEEEEVTASTSYKNWSPLTDLHLKQEYEWEYKNKTIHRYGDIWPTLEDFKKAVQVGKVVTVTDEMFNRIGNTTDFDSIEDLEDFVQGYQFPRDVQRIKEGFEKGDAIPYPIVLDLGSQLETMTGNTRLNTARIMGVKPKVLVVKVPKEKQTDAGVEDTDYPYFHVSDLPLTPRIPESLIKKPGGRRGLLEPLGIFLFIKGEKIATEGFSERKYRWDAKLKPGTRITQIWDLPKSLHSYISFEKFMQNQRDRTVVEDYDRYMELYQDWLNDHEQIADKYTFWQWLEDTDYYWGALVSSVADSGKLTNILKGKGIQVLLDENGYHFFAGEPQLLVVDPTCIQWGPREENSKDKKVYRMSGSLQSLKHKFQDLYEDEDFYENEFLDFYEGAEGQDRKHYDINYSNFKYQLDTWEWGEKGVKAYRGISAKSLKELNLNNLGNAWSWDLDMARSYYSGSGTDFIFEAEIPEDAIDLEVTLRQNLVVGDELEIRTEGESTVYLHAILDKNKKAVKTFNPPLETSTGGIGVAGDWVASSLQDWSGKWIHYSQHPEVKINPKSLFRDPAGIYLFPKEFPTSGSWKYFKYKFEVEIDPNLKVLDFATITEDEMKSIWTHFFPELGEFDFSQNTYTTNKVDFWWERIAERMVGKAGEFNRKLRDLGYDALFDDTASIHSAEVQLVLLNPKKMISYKIVNDKASTFEVIKEVTDALAELCEPFGPVQVEGPKKKRTYGEEKLMAYVTVGDHNSKYASWQVHDWTQKGESMPRDIRVYLSSDSSSLSWKSGRSWGATLDFPDWKSAWPKATKEILSVMNQVFNPQVSSQLEVEKEQWDNKLTLSAYRGEQLVAKIQAEKIEDELHYLTEGIEEFLTPHLTQELIDWAKELGIEKVYALTSKTLEDGWTEYQRNYTEGKYRGYRKPTEKAFEELKQQFGWPKSEILYRAVRAESLEAIDFNKIGIYWTNNPDMAQAYWGDKDQSFFKITAKVKECCVDWLGTIEANMRLVYGGEEEVTLLEGAELEILKVEVYEDGFHELEVKEKKATAFIDERYFTPHDETWTATNPIFPQVFPTYVQTALDKGLFQKLANRMNCGLAIFGSSQNSENPNDIDLVLAPEALTLSERLKPKVKEALIALALETGKQIDAFFGPVRNESENGKALISPDGKVKYETVFCGAGFFDDIEKPENQFEPSGSQTKSAFYFWESETPYDTHPMDDSVADVGTITERPGPWPSHPLMETRAYADSIDNKRQLNYKDTTEDTQDLFTENGRVWINQDYLETQKKSSKRWKKDLTYTSSKSVKILTNAPLKGYESFLILNPQKFQQALKELQSKHPEIAQSYLEWADVPSDLSKISFYGNSFSPTKDGFGKMRYVRARVQEGIQKNPIRMIFVATLYPLKTSGSVLLEFIEMGEKYEMEKKYHDKPVVVSTPLEVVEASTKAELERIAQGYIDKFFNGMPMPEFKIANQMSANWLGICEMNWQDKVPTIRIQKSVMGDERTLDRVIAHEMIHAYLYLNLPEYLAMFEFARKNGGQLERSRLHEWKKLKEAAEAKGGHGPEFMKWADKINKVKGQNYVNEKSDETDVVDEKTHAKEFYILVEKTKTGKWGYNTFMKKTPKILQALEYRQNTYDARLFKIKDPEWYNEKSLTMYGGCYVPREENGQQFLKDLYEKDETVRIAADLEDASEVIASKNLKVKPSDLEDAWTVFRFAMGMSEDEKEYYTEEELSDLKESWDEALKKATLETWGVQEAAESIGVSDHGRRPKGKQLENPVIVAKVGPSYVMLDGSHRLITKYENEDESISVFIIPLDWADSLTEMEGEILASVKKAEAAKQVGILYHFTTPDAFREIVQDGWKLRTLNREAISFTRDYQLKFKPSAEARDEDGEGTGNWFDIPSTVRITVDGDKLSNRYKIKPFADGGPFARQGGQNESEQILPGTEANIEGAVLQVDQLNGFSYEKEEGEEFAYQDEAAQDVGPLTRKHGIEFNKVGYWTPYLTEDKIASSHEDEKDFSHLPSIKDIEKLKAELAKAAQKPYDNWQVDEEGYDWQVGSGGICHLIVDAMLEVLDKHGIPCQSLSLDYKVHVVAIAQVREGIAEIDIHHDHYETGGGYSWKKIEGVEFTPDMVDVHLISRDPNDWDTNYSEGKVAASAKVTLYRGPWNSNYPTKREGLFGDHITEEAKASGYEAVKLLGDVDGGEQIIFLKEPKWNNSITAKLNVEFHTVMLNAEDCSPPDVTLQFAEVSKMIPQAAIYEEHPYQTDFPDGREKLPHVTVLFGLKNDEDLEKIKAHVATLPPIQFEIGDISAFRNDDKPYDVLKLSIWSPDMEDLHYWIRENFDNECKFDFNGHMTLAYIKKGTCQDLEGPCEWTGAKYTCSNLIFSHKSDGHFQMPMGGEKVESSANKVTSWKAQETLSSDDPRIKKLIQRRYWEVDGWEDSPNNQHPGKGWTNGDTKAWIMDQIQKGKEFVVLMEEKKNGDLMIRDGWHRFAAMIDLGLKEIPVQILNKKKAKTEAKLAPADTLFKEWFKAYGKDEGLAIQLGLSPEETDDITPEKARNWFDRRYKHVTKKLQEARHESGVIAYRCLSVTEIWIEKAREGKIKAVGGHWTIDPDLAPGLCGGHGNHLGRGGLTVVLEAYIPFTEIDLLSLFNPNWADEWEEYEIMPENYVYLLRVLEPNLDKVIYEYPKPTKLPIYAPNVIGSHAPDMVKFVGLMKKNNLNTTKDVVEFLKNKWDGISSAVQKGYKTFPAIVGVENPNAVDAKVEAGISPILFHLTGLTAANEIIKTNQFKLVNDRGTGSDQRRQGKEWFYLSTSRSLLNRYQKIVGPQTVILVLDGDKLGQRYAGSPVDYWGFGPGEKEAEDRIWSKHHIIPNAKKYIKEVHVYMPKDSSWESSAVWRDKLRSLMIESKKVEIPIYVYEDEAAFKLLNEKKAVPFSELQDRLKGGERVAPWSRADRKDFISYLELMQKPVGKELSKEGERLLYKTRYYVDDAVRSLNADIHNARGSHAPDMVKFVGLMKKNNLNTTKDVVEFLKNKWDGVELKKYRGW